MILRPPPRPPVPHPQRLAERFARRPLPRLRQSLVDPGAALLPTLYCLLPLDAILAALRDTGAASARVRRLPAHEVVWLVVASCLFRGRSLPMVWRHVRPSCERAGPADSAFTQARQRLGALPLKLLFHRTCRPLAPAKMAGAWHGPWLVVAPDGSVLETRG